jgi:ribosomal protein L37AE/L43A
MTHFSEYEDTDKAALVNALLQLHTCPHCRADLQPVALCKDVWGCSACKKTWHVPSVEK